MDVRLLGELEVVGDDGSFLSVKGAKQRALLAVLALHRGEPIGADRLIDGLWGDDPPGNPANALQALVANLRRALGSASLATSEAGYSLSIEPGDVDIVRFEQRVGEGRRCLGDGDAARAADELRAALALVRDEPLVEFAFMDFATAERARLDELILLATEARIEADLAMGRHGELVGDLEAL